ncbi:hypothetical protein [Bifidobacterium eulemuris]|nr:hypothetical protein [Bifidobacterium eulemuris]
MMARPVVYTDFDGVLNAFPDDKVLRRGGQAHLDWLKDGDPRKTLYDVRNAFLLDRTRRVPTPMGKFRVRWSAELTDALHAMALVGDIELNWLSTWQPFTAALNETLSWGPEIVSTVNWYDPVSGQGRLTGKRRTVFCRVEAECQFADSAPIVWIDDEECYDSVAMQLESLNPASPVLMVHPDDRIGISRRQWRLIERFVDDPASFEPVTLDEEPTLHNRSGHIGF